jgi:erythromycin esterase
MGLRFVALAIAGSLLLGGAAAAPAQVVEIKGDKPFKVGAPEPDEAAALRWLEANRRTFSSATPEPQQLAQLTGRLDGAQVIGIGEATHGTHEDLAFKSALIKQLVREGRIGVVALEANRAIGTALDAYVRRGEGDLAAIIRSRSFYRIWRTEEFAELMLWLRAWNLAGGRQVGVIGIDMQDSSADAAAALAFVAPRAPEEAAAISAGLGDLLPNPEPVRLYNWVTAADAAKLKRAQDAAQRLHALLARRIDWAGDPGHADALYAAQVAVQGLRLFEKEVRGATVDPHDYAYLALRDRMMAANLTQLAGTEPTALWAHDMHVLGEPGPSTLFPAEFTWIGRELERALGPRYVTVTFAWSDGRFHAATIDPKAGNPGVNQSALVPQKVDNKGPGTLGGFLADVPGERWWVDLRALPDAPWARSWSKAPYFRGFAGWGVNRDAWHRTHNDTLPLRTATDILVYFRTITPTRLWPGHDLKPVAPAP